MATSIWTSRHRLKYIGIALKHFTTPKRVFDLAHGKAEVHEKDRKIMHDLKEAGIIHHRHKTRGSLK